MIKTKLTIIAIAILATTLIATPTVFSNSLIKTAFAKTTHNYCWLGSFIDGRGGTGACYETLSQCQEQQAYWTGLGEIRITKDCYKFTDSGNKNRDNAHPKINYCFDLSRDQLPNETRCFGNKQQCESHREALAVADGWKVQSLCYKI